MNRPARQPLPSRRESGQASVVTIGFAVVLVLVALSLFRTGRLATDKMALQNAADALAYSVSTVEARDLNFAAYTNRAIIANEVAIGQALGLYSWGVHHESVGGYLRTYDLLTLAVPTLGSSTSIVDKIASFGFEKPGKFIQQIMRIYARAMAIMNSHINLAYGSAQQVHHLATLMNAVGLYQNIPQANGPDGTDLSTHGILMLVSHLLTFGALPTPADFVAQLPSAVKPHLTPFSQLFLPNIKSDRLDDLDDANPDTRKKESPYYYGRLAAMITNSGDPFTKGHHNDPITLPGGTVVQGPDRTGRGWELNPLAWLTSPPLDALLPAPHIIINCPGGGGGGISGNTINCPQAAFVPFNAQVAAGIFQPGWLGMNFSGAAAVPLTPPGGLCIPGIPAIFDPITGTQITPAVPPTCMSVTLNFGLNFSLEVKFALQREGGSELRFVSPFVPPGGRKAAGELVGWSSADTTNASVDFHSPIQNAVLPGGVVVRQPPNTLTSSLQVNGSGPLWFLPNNITVPGPSLSAGLNLDRQTEQLDFNLNFAWQPPGIGPFNLPAINIPLQNYSGYLPANLPFGSGFGQAANTSKKANLTVDPRHMATYPGVTLPKLPTPTGQQRFPSPAGPVRAATPDPAYGGAPFGRLAWYVPVLPGLANPPPAGVMAQANPIVYSQRNVEPSHYRGLPPFSDTTGSEPLFKTGGPMLVVGLTLPGDTFKQAHYDQHAGTEPQGRFKLDEHFGQGPNGTDCDQISAIAKSEVYFKRPLDIGYFARGDGYEEHGNAFNPYWQARLIETSHFDRVVALLLQHGVLTQSVTVGGNSYDRNALMAMLGPLQPVAAMVQQWVNMGLATVCS